MRDFDSKRYWLIGASDGLGAALAKRLSEAGAEVIVSARSEDKLRTVGERAPRACLGRGLATSPTAPRSRPRPSGSARSTAWCSSPGLYWPQKAQDWDAGQVEAMCERELHRPARGPSVR